MSEFDVAVSTGPQNMVSMPYPMTWQSAVKTCVHCERVGPDELILLCRKHGGTHVHMQCFWKLQSYRSKIGNTYDEIKRCPKKDCTELLRITYNNKDVVFPISKSQRILFVANPFVWILGIFCAITFCLMFTQCSRTACMNGSFVIHVLASFFFVVGLVTRPTDPVNYLEMSTCKRLAKLRAFSEVLVVIVALIVGSVPAMYFNPVYDVNYGFAIWLLLYQLFVLPTVCIYYIKKHINLIAKVNSLTVSTNSASFAPTKTPVVYLDLPLDLST